MARARPGCSLALLSDMQHLLHPDCGFPSEKQRKHFPSCPLGGKLGRKRHHCPAGSQAAGPRCPAPEQTGSLLCRAGSSPRAHRAATRHRAGQSELDSEKMKGKPLSRKCSPLGLLQGGAHTPCRRGPGGSWEEYLYLSTASRPMFKSHRRKGK